MRFVDEARISVKAGHGGSGSVHFRREKFIPKGGPDGGDGGNGGSVILRADGRLLTLYDFRLKRHYAAQNGQNGMGRQMYGRKGEDLVLHLPVGTMVYVESGDEEHLLTDLSEPDQEFVVAKGGRGGLGNIHFKSSTMRAPHFAQPGEPVRNTRSGWNSRFSLTRVFSVCPTPASPHFFRRFLRPGRKSPAIPSRRWCLCSA